MDFQPGNLIAERFQETRRQLRKLWLKLWGAGFFVVFVGFIIAWIFVKPAPPRHVKIAAGPRDGAYFSFASQYAQRLRRHGITLEVVSTAGSIENCQLLNADQDVHLAIVQGGTIPAEMLADEKIESLGSLYLEPIWIFYRSDQPYADLRKFSGRRLAIGLPNSGTQAAARLLLNDNGVIASEDTAFLETGGRQAMQQLLDGDVDGAFFVMSPKAALVQELMRCERLRLFCFHRHAAYARRHPFLSDVILRRGVVDMAADLPSEDVELVAPAANLVATPALHDALVPVLLKAATQVHASGDILVRSGRFPSSEFVEAPLNESARLYFESGPPFLQKFMPFWIASAIDRSVILLLPAITLLLPLFKIAPPLYRWRIRSRIYKWYEVLREIEADINRKASEEVLTKHLLTLNEMEQELDELDSVPLPYMEEFYNLRLHVEFVERRLERVQRRVLGDA
jgi:TRAP-type uncharacterized transport system substrate-binding protein